MKRFCWSVAATIAFLVSSSSLQAAETFLISGATGNGDFQITSGAEFGPNSYNDTPNWFNAGPSGGGDDELPFTNTSQMGGSSQPGSRGGMPFHERMQINDTPYTISAAGEVFNVSYDFGAGGAPGAWAGDEFMRSFLFTSATPVGVDTVPGDIVELGGDSYFMNRDTQPQWTSHSSNAFYTSTAGDIGKTIYFGMEFMAPTNTTSLFPRIDVLTLSTGVPDPFQLQFNAATNPAPNTNEWYPTLDTSTGAGNSPTDFFTFAGAISANVVNDPSVPGITASYSAGGQGRNHFDTGANANINGSAYQGSFDASFEVWFEPDNLAGGEQIILELGGSGNGSYFSLEDDVLSFYSRSNGVDGPTLSTTLTDAEWTQVVGTWEGSTDTLELYVNGQFVTSATAAGNINEWAGGNAWGIGQRGESDGDPGNDIAVGGPLTEAAGTDFAFAGEIAIFQLHDKVLSAAEVQAAFDAIAASSALEGDSNGDGVVNTLDIDPFVQALTDPSGYTAAFPAVDFLGANDINDDGVVNTLDIDPFVGILTGPGAIATPEPSAVALLAITIPRVLARRRLQ